MKKKAFLLFLAIGAFSMIVMSNHYLLSNNTGILKRKEVATTLCYLTAFRVHILFGLVAISSGIGQFIRKLRAKKGMHRAVGYTYASSIVLSSLAGFVIAPFAMGGWISTVGFSILSAVWLYTTLKAIFAIRSKQIESHRKWAHYSYAITFSSITQRTLLLIPLLTNVPFMPIYRLSAWLPWMINLGVAYFILNRSNTVKTNNGNPTN